jgi:hypothetical protein
MDCRHYQKTAFMQRGQIQCSVCIAEAIERLRVEYEHLRRKVEELGTKLGDN